jgi:hypothetical protein
MKSLIGEHVKKYFESCKDGFSKQYEIHELNNISREILNSKSFMEFALSLRNKFFPTSEQIVSVVSKINYINDQTCFFGKPTHFEIEKKLDYFHIAYLIILEYWAINILPEQDNIMPEVTGIDEDKAKFINIDAGWGTAEKLIDRVNEMYDELEREYKQ